MIGTGAEPMRGNLPARWARASGAYAFSRRGLQLLSIAALAVGWEVYGRLDTTLLFPPLSRVLVAWWELLWSGELLMAFGVSLQAFVVGFGLSVSVGIWIGLLMARFRIFELIWRPYLDILVAAPTIAFVPLFVIWFGLGLTSRVGVIISFAFPIIALTAFTALKGVDRDLIEMGRAFNLRGLKLFWKVALPSALPLLVAGLRLGASRAFVGMVAADILLVATGVGELIQTYNATFQTANLFASILSVILFAVLLIELFRLLERRVLRGIGRGG